jgi:hypothetical protein
MGGTMFRIGDEVFVHLEPFPDTGRIISIVDEDTYRVEHDCDKNSITDRTKIMLHKIDKYPFETDIFRDYWYSRKFIVEKRGIIFMVIYSGGIKRPIGGRRGRDRVPC